MAVTRQLKRSRTAIAWFLIMPSFVLIGILVMEKNFFLTYFVNIFSPLEKGHGRSFKQTGIPITKECFAPNLVEISQLVLENFFLKNPSMHLRFFVIISPWKKMWPFISTNFNPLHPRRLCASLVEINLVVL